MTRGSVGGRFAPASSWAPAAATAAFALPPRLRSRIPPAVDSQERFLLQRLPGLVTFGNVLRGSGNRRVGASGSQAICWLMGISVLFSLAAVIASVVDLATVVRMSLPRRAMHAERGLRFVCSGWATVRCSGLLFLRESDCRGTLRPRACRGCP